MSLDIRISQRKKVICPKCGEVAGHTEVRAADSSGSRWYTPLERFGYYQRSDAMYDGYGKDMVLTREQADYMYQFVKKTDVYNQYEILGMIASALYEGDDVVINADW